MTDTQNDIENDIETDTDFVFPLMLGLDGSSLTMSLITIGSPTGHERPLANSVEAALTPFAHLHLERVGNTVVARTDEGHSERVVVVGHLGTDSGDADDYPVSFVEMGKLFGPGAAGVKGGLAVLLKAAALAPTARGRDVTFVLYDDLESLAATRPELLAADFAIVMQPVRAGVAGGDAILQHPRAQRMIELTELEAVPLQEIPHDLQVFEALGVPSLAFGPGDPALVGTPGEFVPTAQVSQCEYVLREWLS